MCEWLKQIVSKTIERKFREGSNPSLHAKETLKRVPERVTGGNPLLEEVSLEAAIFNE